MTSRTFRCVCVSRALAAGTAHQARRHTHVRIARSINSLVFGCQPPPPARAVGGALGGSDRPCDVGGILRCIPMPFAIAARPRPPVRHERAPLSRRVMMAAAGRYAPRGRPVEARPHDMSVCHATRHQVRVRKWSLGARKAERIRCQRPIPPAGHASWRSAATGAVSRPRATPRSRHLCVSRAV